MHSPDRRLCRNDAPSTEIKIRGPYPVLASETSASMATAYQHYRREDDRQVQVATTFQTGDWLFIDSPQLAKTSGTDSARATSSAYSNLMARSWGPFCVKAVCPHSTVIDERGISNVDLANRASQAPHTECLVLTNIISTR